MEVGVRRGTLNLALLAVCGAVLASAQAISTHPAAHGQARPVPHRQSQPAPSSRPATPPVYFDATRMGSPVVLNRGWRVGITANPDAAKPDFDDSHWAVRNATGEIADVPDDDEPTQPAHAQGRPQAIDKSPGKFVWFRL